MDEEGTETTQETGEDLLRQVLLRFTNERRSAMVSSYYSLDLIKYLMKTLGLSQKEVAGMIGVSRQSMSSLMNGRVVPKKFHLLAITYTLEKYMEANNIIFDRYREQITIFPNQLFEEAKV